MTNKLVSKYSFEMPDVGDITTLTVSNCASISPNCWIWNTSVGYLEVIDFKEPEVTVRNLGRIENAKAGSEFPSCMEFLIVAPDSLPLYDPTVTCLAADFISPEVNDTAIMVVVDTSKIRETDVLIIDRKYRYTVVSIIDDHQVEVRNEGWGKEPGEVIDVVCDECISVKILESTYCCKVVREELQEEIDDINDRLDNKKSILPSDLNNLVTVSGGTGVLTDAPTDTVIYVNNDLSNYDNSVTQYITSGDIPAIGNGHLYIQDSGGTQLADFTANQSGNTTFTLPPYPVVPTVGNGHLYIQDSNGNVLADFTANQGGNTTCVLPASPIIPTVPSRYSGVITDYQSATSFTVKLESENNDGSAYDDNESLSNRFTPVSFSTSGLSGSKVNLYGTIVLTCSGKYNSDTHTFNLHDEVSSASAYNTLVTARGPTLELRASPKISGTSIYAQPISSGKNYYFRLDYVNAPLGSVTSPAEDFSIQITIPIACEINANASYNVSLDITIYGYTLRKVHKTGTGINFVNEEVSATVNSLTAHTALYWVIK